MSLRPLRPGDDEPIRRLFRATVALGRPLAAPVADFDVYERLCLDWYLGPGRRDAAVAEQDGGVVGYVLVCTDQRAFGRWRRGAVAALLRRIGPKLATRRYDEFTDRFFRLRLRDGWELWRRAPRGTAAAHAHFNAASGARSGLVVRDFVAHVERACARAGIDAWTGEMNAPVGRRERVLERYGARIVHRARNHTLSWLAGETIERLTVVRPVGDIVRVDATPGTAPMTTAPVVAASAVEVAATRRSGLLRRR